MIEGLVKWSYSLSKMNISLILKAYLDKQTVTNPIFRNNVVGKGFIIDFTTGYNG